MPNICNRQSKDIRLCDFDIGCAIQDEDSEHGAEEIEVSELHGDHLGVGRVQQGGCQGRAGGGGRVLVVDEALRGECGDVPAGDSV